MSNNGPVQGGVQQFPGLKMRSPASQGNSRAVSYQQRCRSLSADRGVSARSVDRVLSTGAMPMGCLACRRRFPVPRVRPLGKHQRFPARENGHRQ
jgi:hypothetical protein